ncbi:serine/threonine-protein kinase, partial [Frankia nepalensis]
MADAPGVLPLDWDDPPHVGPYTLLGRLGDGPLGSVYLARRAEDPDDPDHPDDRYAAGGHPDADGPDKRDLVALKVVRADLARIPEFRRRFLREARAALRVARFCTAAVLDVDVAGPRPYLVTEYVNGPTLAAEVDDWGPLAAVELERLGTAAAAALTAIHAAGVVHADLRPSNILLSPSGARVIDFGIARALDAVTAPASLRADAAGYLSPERALGDEVTEAADVHAWGAVMVYAATGRGPFGEGSASAVLRRVVDEQPDLRGVPAGLALIVARAMSKIPAYRPTAEELLLLLDRVRAAGRTPPPAAGPTAQRMLPAPARDEPGGWPDAEPWDTGPR